MLNIRSLKKFAGSLLPLFVAAHFTHHLMNAVAVPLLPMIRTTFDLSYTKSGLLLSAFTLTYGFAQLPAGWIANRIGSRHLIIIGIVGVGVAGLLAGASTSFIMLFIAQILIGLSGSGYHPASTSMISNLTAPDIRGQALGIHVTGGSASHFVAPLIAAGVAAVWGWRGAYFTLAVPSIIIGSVFWLLLRNHHRRTSAEADNKKRTAEKELVISWPRLITVLLLVTLNGATVGSVMGFIPLYAVDTFGLSEENAARLLAVVFSAGLLVSPLAGFLSDKLGRIPLLLIVSIMIGPIVYLFTVVPMGPLYIVLLLGLGIFQFVRMPVSESFIVAETTPKIRTTMLGIYFFGGAMGGGLLTPVLGWMIDRIAFQESFRIMALILSVLAVVGTVAIIFTRSPEKRRKVAQSGAS